MIQLTLNLFIDIICSIIYILQELLIESSMNYIVSQFSYKLKYFLSWRMKLVRDNFLSVIISLRPHILILCLSTLFIFFLNLMDQ